MFEERRNIARARTDERGRRLMGSFPGHMKAGKLTVTPNCDPRATTPVRWHRGKLGDLLGDNWSIVKYNLLAQHLLSLGASPLTDVRYGKLGQRKYIAYISENGPRERGRVKEFSEFKGAISFRFVD